MKRKLAPARPGRRNAPAPTPATGGAPSGGRAAAKPLSHTWAEPSALPQPVFIETTTAARPPLAVWPD
jgi:hypothetical protein